MGLYEVPLSLLGFGTMLANFHVCGIMLVLIAVFNMLVSNASPREYVGLTVVISGDYVCCSVVFGTLVCV